MSAHDKFTTYVKSMSIINRFLIPCTLPGYIMVIPKWLHISDR